MWLGKSNDCNCQPHKPVTPTSIQGLSTPVMNHGVHCESVRIFFRFNQRICKQNAHCPSEIGIFAHHFLKPFWQQAMPEPKVRVLLIIEQAIPNVLIVEVGPELQHIGSIFVLLLDTLKGNIPCSVNTAIIIFPRCEVRMGLVFHENTPSSIV